MRFIYCDKCGEKHQGKGSGFLVKPVRAGLENGGRVLDLCGDCRGKFNSLVDEWLDPDTPDTPVRMVTVTLPNGAVWNMLPGAYDFDGKSFSIPVHLQPRGTTMTGHRSSPESAPEISPGGCPGTKQ